jgi:hypothetical protein
MPRVFPALGLLASLTERPYALLVDDHDPSLKRFHAFVELAGLCCASVHSAPKARGYCDIRRPRSS